MDTPCCHSATREKFFNLTTFVEFRSLMTRDREQRMRRRGVGKVCSVYRGLLREREVEEELDWKEGMRMRIL
jgi:hypothetical protein